jgi:hypothetical protein
MGIQFHVYRPNLLESSKMTLEQTDVSLLLAARLGAVITKDSRRRDGTMDDAKMGAHIAT